MVLTQLACESLVQGTEAWLPAELVDKMKVSRAAMEGHVDATAVGCEEGHMTQLVSSSQGLVHGFFYLPAARKLAIQMDREPVFMGYNPVGYEVTKGRVDNRGERR